MRRLKSASKASELNLMKTGLRAYAIKTKYWRPGENYILEIVKGVSGKILDGDFLVVSEKAISVALGNIVDESRVHPSFNAKIIAKIWMPLIWGYILGFLCRLKPRLLQQLRNYPRDAGSRHKQVALQYASLMQALMFGSEGGIDGSNLPYAYVSLPLENAQMAAEEIRRKIREVLGKNVCVIIADTDKTYSFRSFHFTPRPRPIRGIHSFGGFVSYLVGRILKLKRRATPLAVAGCLLSAEEALEIAEFANRARGCGAGRTVWEMAERFGVGLTEVSWEMLETLEHKPIVIVRKTNEHRGSDR